MKVKLVRDCAVYGKPYKAGKVLEVGKELTDAQARELLRLGRAQPAQERRAAAAQETANGG